MASAVIQKSEILDEPNFLVETQNHEQHESHVHHQHHEHKQHHDQVHYDVYEIRNYGENSRKLVFYMVLTSLFLMWVFFYVLYQALNPWIVQQGDCGYNPNDCCKRPPDNAKCLAASLITTVFVSIFLWLIFASLY